jgi:protein O-GlcNAc transferase
MNRKHRRAAAKRGPTSGNPAAAAVAVPPEVAELLGTGRKHHQAGRLAEAEACYRQVLAAQPDRADVLHLLGVIAQQDGRPDRAVALIAEAIKRDRQNPFYYSDLGAALRQQGRPEEAVAAYREAIRIKPDLAKTHSNLGNALKDQGKFDEAVAAFRQAIHIEPGFAQAFANLGIALQLQGKSDESVAACRQAIRIRPDYADAYFNLANALREQGKLDEAIAAFREAIRIEPGMAPAFSNLGNVLRDLGRLQEAVGAYREALRIKPDLAQTLSNLANALQDQGKLDEAVAAFRQAIDARPDDPLAHSNLLFCLNRDDRVSAARLFAEHREWDRKFGRSAPRVTAHANDRDAGRRLRIGYVSPDFRLHSVAYFLEPLLKAHDRQVVEVFCYAEVLRPDMVTAHLQGFADHWRPTVALSDDELARRIQADAIDILVDLAGHTSNNRLLVFARKPAPVQVTWLGYPNTTGLEAIDYRLVDAVTDPDGEGGAPVSEVCASETLVRLEGCFLCFGAIRGAPEPAAPPRLKTGTVTFGSFNNATKVSPATFDAWAMLLRRLPEAQLLLKGKQFADAAARALLLARLAERGVAPERVELVAWVPNTVAHLALYDQVDIALDPFPYNGTTTTCEALWMGVPVVTLRGDRHAGRVGASLLGQIGLTDLVADSVGEYVAIALALANNSERLNDLRGSLRPRLAASSLCDGPAFARKIEAAFRQMWRLWCEAPNDLQRY